MIEICAAKTMITAATGTISRSKPSVLTRMGVATNRNRKKIQHVNWIGLMTSKAFRKIDAASSTANCLAICRYIKPSRAEGAASMVALINSEIALACLVVAHFANFRLLMSRNALSVLEPVISANVRLRADGVTLPRRKRGCILKVQTPTGEI